MWFHCGKNVNIFTVAVASEFRMLVEEVWAIEDSHAAEDQNNS